MYLNYNISRRMNACFVCMTHDQILVLESDLEPVSVPAIIHNLIDVEGGKC